MDGGKILIISDGKPGHFNQSIALARHLGVEFELVQVGFRSRFFKGLSYFLDHLGLRPANLFTAIQPSGRYCAVVSTGSETYFANKSLARRLGLPSVAIMLPRGYRYDFDLIIAQRHDRPPARRNILTLPVNLNFVVPGGLVPREPDARYVSLVIGGSNKVFSLEAEPLRQVIDEIFARFPGHRILVTTSRRTSPDIENLVLEYPFAAKFIYSRDPANPIPDFLAISDYVFLTGDSTSMISEAASFGNACIEVIPLQSKGGGGKFFRLIEALAAEGCLHIYDGTVAECRRKIDLRDCLKEVRLCG